MTRIVAGTAKGRQLAVPAQGTRPTSAKVREALFSMLESWNLVRERRVLDLFAGSGALAFEAFSRGASEITLVDKSRGAQKVLAQNARTVGASSARIVAGSAQAFVRSARATFDLVFVDPPYAWPEPDLTELLADLLGLLDPDGLIVVERDARSPQPSLPAGLELESERSWGDTRAYLIGRPPADPSAD
ncbi:16S rRNA (guanine(966)-N(2))-methyltransferase RsmD [Actinomyces sp. F1_1611]